MGSTHEGLGPDPAGTPVGLGWPADEAADEMLADPPPTVPGAHLPADPVGLGWPDDRPTADPRPQR